MNAIPNITVQLVHIEGPLKGQIQEFNSPEIVFGRHPDCQVQFPQTAVTLSRKHARIVREGNRFKLIDQSTNGTLVNGHFIHESFLKEGDVITFSEQGPKVSFLTETNDIITPPAPSASPPAIRPSDQPPESPSPRILGSIPVPKGGDINGHNNPASNPAPPAPPPPVSSVHRSKGTAARSGEQSIEKKSIQFVIQFGPAIKSFQTLPITLGKGDHCDFAINNPALCGQQAQIFFEKDEYWIKDLTGTNTVMINDIPILDTAVLKPDFQLSLSPQGPRFRFLKGGRLLEIEEQAPKIPEPTRRDEPVISAEPGKLASIVKKAESLVKKAVGTPQKSEK